MITDQNGNVFDGRIEQTSAFISYLVSKVNLLSNILILPNGNQLTVLNNPSTAQLVRKSDLFTIYFKNNLMVVSPSDLLGLSSLINQAWIQYYNRTNA